MSGEAWIKELVIKYPVWIESFHDQLEWIHIVHLVENKSMLAKTHAAAVHGVDARTIEVEVNSGGEVAQGTPMYFLVGLPDNAIREGWQRMEAAIKNIGYRMPRCKIVANLAPADIRKEGSSYDLPIVTAIAASTGMISDEKIGRYMLVGELRYKHAGKNLKGWSSRKPMLKRRLLSTNSMYME